MQHVGIFLIFAASVKSAGVYTSVKLYSLWNNFFARSFTPPTTCWAAASR